MGAQWTGRGRLNRLETVEEALDRGVFGGPTLKDLEREMARV